MLTLSSLFLYRHSRQCWRRCRQPELAVLLRADRAAPAEARNRHRGHTTVVADVSVSNGCSHGVNSAPLSVVCLLSAVFRRSCLPSVSLCDGITGSRAAAESFMRTHAHKLRAWGYDSDRVFPAGFGLEFYGPVLDDASFAVWRRAA